MALLNVAIMLVVIAAAVSGFVLIRGENRWNRLLGYNVVAGKVTIAIVLLAAITRNSFYLDIAVVYALLSFMGVTALSDYLVEQGTRGTNISDDDGADSGRDGVVVITESLGGGDAVA